MRCTSLLFAPFLALPLRADEPKWDVNAPPGPATKFALDVREGTWIALDVSPDGQELAFDLLGDIYLLPIEGGEARAIASGVAWQMQPRYSPDGKRIAFTSDQGGGDNVWLMERDGSHARAVTSETYRLLNSPCWSPGGQWIAARKHFTSRRSLGAGEIWLYHESGGEGLQLTTRASEQKDLGEPAFSPDGRYVYFSYDSTPGGNFTTGERVTLVSGPGGACRPVPAHDGKRLAFVRRVRFQTELFVMDLASGEAHAVYGPLERDMQETWAIHGVYPAFAWTPRDDALVFYAKGRLQRLDLATKQVHEIPFHVKDERAVTQAVRFPVEVAPEQFQVKALRNVVVSPKGDRVAYEALRTIFIRELPEGQPKRLTTFTPHFEFEPSFSRDGQWIVYTDWDDDELGSIRVIPASGGEPRVVTKEPGHYFEPVFTPDGKQIVYRKGAGGGLVSPLWSRDPGIYRVSVDGGESKLITKKGHSPQFGAQSDRVYLMSEEEQKDTDHRTLWSVTLDGAEERVQLSSEWATSFALSPNGKWVAFSERFNAWIAPFEPTGREVAVGPKSKALPIARASRDAGENLQFSGDSQRLYWSLGPELYERDLKDSFRPRAATSPSRWSTRSPRVSSRSWAAA